MALLSFPLAYESRLDRSDQQIDHSFRDAGGAAGALGTAGALGATGTFGAAGALGVLDAAGASSVNTWPQ